MKVSIVIYVLLYLHNQVQFCGKVDCSIVSQSSISICEAGDDKNPKGKDGSFCKKKMLVSMTLKGGQGETESVYANIDQVYEKDETELSRLRKPFRIEISKTLVTASYRVHYIGSANARPSEVSVTKKKCKEGWHEKNSSLACGKQIDSDGEPIWDSQGFCCKCKGSLLVKQEEENDRGGLSCSIWLRSRKYSSAHCMEFNKLWYNVFDVGPPMLQYNITVRLLEFEGVLKNNTANTISAKWTPVSTFSLNPTKTISRSRNGKVVAEIQGDLLGAHGPSQFSYKNLLIPSITHWTDETLPQQYTNGPSDWMLVDKHMVDLSGSVCSKIGVSYTGFRRQPGKCDRSLNSCFTNQPLDLWKHDNLLRAENKSGFYFLSNFGNIDSSSHPTNTSFILKFFHEDLHNTFITMRIDASDLLFVHNVGNGRIVDTYAIDFEALSGKGEIVVIVENTGEITAEFSVSILKCNTGVHTVSAKTATIDPGEDKKVTFIVQSYKAKGTQYECDIQLYDSDFNLLQTGRVNFKTNSTCFCFGLCGCTCEGAVSCPDPPPISVNKPSNIARRIFFLILEIIGLHGFIGIIGGILIILGFIKLLFGSVLFCRKTKAQKFAAELKKQGIISNQGPTLVQCSGECNGARAAQDRYKRKVWRLKKMGKKLNKLDDWRNYSYSCSCKNDLVDIRFVEVLKSIFYFYYCLMFPCVWLGKKVIWGIFKDTAAQKKKAVDDVLKKAKKKGKLSKYGITENEMEEPNQSIGNEEKIKDRGPGEKGANQHKRKSSCEIEDDKSNEEQKGKKNKNKKTSRAKVSARETAKNLNGNDSQELELIEDNVQIEEDQNELTHLLESDKQSEQKVRKKKRRGKKRPSKPHGRRRSKGNKNKENKHSDDDESNTSQSSNDESESNDTELESSNDESESTSNDSESNESIDSSGNDIKIEEKRAIKQ